MVAPILCSSHPPHLPYYIIRVPGHACALRRQIVLCLLRYNLHRTYYFKVHNSVLFRMFIRLRSCPHRLIVEHFITHKRNPVLP